ncbi:MAG: tetratricopeptide repeat protein [Thermoplasmata archaeon]
MLHLPPEFVARDQEFAFLKQKLEKAGQKTGSTIFIAGESGVGKTRLVEELISVAEKQGFQVFRGQCFLESLAPYTPISAVLRDAGLDHLLTETKPLRLEALYAVNKGGVIVAKHERLEALDADIFMGMVTAVETFVKDSVSQMQKKEAREEIGHMGYGNFFITNVPGKLLNLVAVTTGRENEYLISEMRELLERIEKEFASAISSSQGTQIAGIEERLKGLFLTGKYEGIDYAEDDVRIRQANLLENVTRGLQRISKQKPVLIFIDDLQWSDPSSLAMLHYIARNTRKNAVLVLGAYRSEEIVTRYDGKVHQLVEAMEKMEKEELLEKIELKRLDKEGCHTLICRVLGTEINPEFTEKIYTETEGNTFFVIEILKNLYEEKQLYFDRGEWHYNLATMQIPKRIYEVVLRRLQRLAREERELLDAASVLGEEFTSNILARITEMNRVRVVKLLLNIERIHKLIKALREKYRFEHAKIREVLYAELGEELKTLYHEIAGKMLEEEYREGKAEVAGDIVYHYSKAGNREKVIEYGLPAGKLAKERFANEDAIKFYKAVLEAMGDEAGYKELRMQVLEELGEVLELTGNYDEALVVLKIWIAELITEKPVEAGVISRKRCEIYIQKGEYEKAMAEVERGEQLLTGVEKGRIELARVWGVKGLVYERKGEYEKAIEWQEKAYEVFEKANVEKEMASTIHRIGTCYWYLGEYEKAMEFYSKALTIRERRGDLRELAGTYNGMGVLYHDKGDYEKALWFYTKSQELMEKIGDVWGIATSYNNIGILYQDKGEYEKALCFYTKSMELREKIGDVRGIASSYNNIGLIYHEKGEYENALVFYTKSLELMEKIGNLRGIAISYNTIGLLYYDEGEYDKALEYHTKGIELAGKIGDKSTLCKGMLAMVECFLALKDFESCRKTLEEAKGIVSELGLKELEGVFLAVSGKLLAAEGNVTEGNEALAKAVEIYESIGKLDIDYYKALFELAKLRKDKGLLDKALAFFEKIGNKEWEEKARAEIGKV